MPKLKRFLIPTLALGLVCLSAAAGAAHTSGQAPSPTATVSAGSSGAGLGGGGIPPGAGGAGLGGGVSSSGAGGAGLGGGSGGPAGAVSATGSAPAAGGSGGAGLGGGRGAVVVSAPGGSGGAGLGGVTDSTSGAGLGGGTNGSGGGAGLSSEPASLEITRDDNGKTLHVVVGQQVVIRLGTDFDWTVDYQPAGILTAVPGVNTLVRGVQGILRAQKPGTVQVQAQGKPHCNPGQACPTLIAVMNATVIVDAASGSGGTVQQPAPGGGTIAPRPSGSINLPNTGAGSAADGTTVPALLLPGVLLLTLLAAGVAVARSLKH